MHGLFLIGVGDGDGKTFASFQGLLSMSRLVLSQRSEQFRGLYDLNLLVLICFPESWQRSCGI